MKKIILFLIISLLLLQIALAEEGLIETYKPREVFDLSVHVTNVTGEVLGANCNVQIRNESLANIADLAMNEIGQGWYNATYNTSKVGNYFCRQNCTLGTQYTAATCDFIIQGDKDMPLAIIIMLTLIVAVYLYFARTFNSEIFSQHGLIKAAIMLFVFWFLLIPLNFGLEVMGQSGATDSMIGMISVVHTVMIYLNILLTAYFIIFVVVSFARSIKANVTK